MVVLPELIESGSFEMFEFSKAFSTVAYTLLRYDLFGILTEDSGLLLYFLHRPKAGTLGDGLAAARSDTGPAVNLV